jgi:UDP-arabinose 4-epimerase
LRVLVTGGAGYIGSHTAKRLAQAAIEPVVYDDLSSGHDWAVQWGPLVRADLGDQETLQATIAKYEISAAIHFAAHAYVGESMLAPRRYFHNNVTNTLTLLDALLNAGVSCFVFSSSCAVYGIPQSIPISEEDAKKPVNPYGESKLFIEHALDWYGRAYGLHWAALRYFNAAGADPSGELGEVHDPEPHLIPRAIESALGRSPDLEVYGLDYPTPDGTAVRDYVHVSDLADGHVAALERLTSGGQSFAANLGTGQGVSVREIIRAVERVAGVPLNAKCSPRRPGDPPVLVADPSRARELLHWNPKLSSPDSIIQTAWRWRRSKLGTGVKG